MNDLLAIAASGVRAFGASLETTGQNIANANTEGYVRRSANLQEVAGAALGRRDGTQAGVRLVGVVRGADAFRAAELRRANGDVARSATQIAGLEAIEGSLASRQPGAALTGFFDAALTLSADPGSGALRAEMLSRADSVADAFRGVAGDLEAARAGADQSLALGVQTLDRAAGDLARVNEQLLRTRPGGTAEAGLLDERDRLLGAMGELAGLTVTFGSHGIAEVSLAGTTDPKLVAGIASTPLSYGIDPKGQPVIALGGAVVAVRGGSLAGGVDALAAFDTARAALDTLAREFATEVNDTQAQGTDANGQPGAPIFTGTGAASLTRTLSDPGGLAAASPDGGSAGNLPAFEEIRDSVRPEQRVQALVTGNAATLSGLKRTAESLDAVARGAEASYFEGAAVSLDQEAANLVRYQQAFQASGRVLQAATAMLDSILAIR